MSFYVVKSVNLQGSVLSESVAAENVIIIPNPNPPTETPTPTPTPSPTPSPTAKPTTTPSPSPTSTPEPTSEPTPVPETIAPSDLEALFVRYAIEYGIDANLLKKIADCESHFNPGSANGPYGGMFQFTATSWINKRLEMGLDPNPDLRFGANESIQTAAYSISRYGAGMWPACSR